MKLLFTGDVNFQGKGIVSFEESKQILQKVMPYFDAADFRIMNLETPLARIEECEPLPKSGPNLICEPENIVFLEAANVDVATMANNHIRDYLDKGIQKTIELLDQHGILHAGAGKNIEDAYKACRLEKDGVKASIISVCENEPGTATKTTYGSAGFDMLTLLKKIREEKEKSDFVIVVFHGGSEYNPLPSPGIRDRYRTIIEIGADAVIAGHTHCPQGTEIYNGKPIVYSLGNFLFMPLTEDDEKESWYYGCMCMLTADKNHGILHEMIPYRFDRQATQITPFEGAEKEKMLEYLALISALIQDEEKLSLYFKGWSISHQLYPKTPDSLQEVTKPILRASNLLHCEAHYELLKTNYKTIINHEVVLAQEWAGKIAELQKMPV